LSTTPAEFIDNVAMGDDGFWHPHRETTVSYPEEGHSVCHGVEQTSFWFLHRNQALQAVVDHFPPPAGHPFLDVGGGNGFVAQMIGALGHRVVLIEPGAAGVEHARERGVTDIVQASIVDLDVRDGSVGGIGLFDVLEHIEDDLAALRRLRRMLTGSGRLYLTVPAHAWLWSSADVQAGHFRRYTRRRLRRLLRNAGFDVEFASYYFWPLALPMLVFRCLPERLGLRKGEDRSERAQREHRPTGTMLGRALGLELTRFRRGRPMPAGASCIVVARNPAQPAG
jgi:SAM-dependent methyltransferase